MANELAPIVIKKKISHAGHHGGAWKVAYADFVTAMMALFIVLWLMSSSSKATQEAIAGYFRDPAGTATKHGSAKQGAADNVPLKKEDLSKLKDTLLHSIHQVNNLQKLKGQIEVTITDEGLRIELMEDKQGTFFESGSAQPTAVL
ncbi:MAG TPA: flagellar motor protein MotB, partial [Acidobacteriaceae bacterium]